MLTVIAAVQILTVEIGGGPVEDVGTGPTPDPIDAPVDMATNRLVGSEMVTRGIKLTRMDGLRVVIAIGVTGIHPRRGRKRLASA